MPSMGLFAAKFVAVPFKVEINIRALATSLKNQVK